MAINKTHYNKTLEEEAIRYGQIFDYLITKTFTNVSI